ncbi:MAG: uracil-DNA glycosylase [Clostridia bacterium]|nr:uracil-DNA glycosylase [Clostridia bacterium]
MSKDLQLDTIKEKCEQCKKCNLYKTKTNTVFGTGSGNAEVMFVGEAPGEKEDLSGIPFVGAAGKLLDKYLEFAGIPRDSVYIANILKCRPPKNRDPLPEEEDACIDFLREQLSVIKPKVIVCLGRISAMRIIKPDFKITAEHGKWFKKGAYKIMAVYHPAALLRDPRKKEDMAEDFLKIAAELSENDD